MYLSWLRLPLVVAAVALTPLSCVIRELDGSPTRHEPDGPQAPLSALRFAHEGSLDLAPGEVHTIVVKSDPPTSYEVSFALLGQTLDASLDRTRVMLDANGVASVDLRAPSAATAFRIIASLNDGPPIEMDVTVGEKGTGSLRILPSYSGNREATEWIASAYLGTSCKALAESSEAAWPAPDKVATAPFDKVPVLEGVPVGPNIAVILSAGASLWGCADEPGLKTNQVLDVKIPITERPIDLLGTNLEVTFDFDLEASAYADILKGVAELLGSAVLPPKSEEAATVLLDAMEEATAPNTDAFKMQRVAQGWDAIAAQHIASRPVSLQDRVTTWVESALTMPGSSQPPKLVMNGALTAAGSASGKAKLVLRDLGGIDAEALGIPGTHILSWSSEASDLVLLNGPIYWLPSRFAGAAAAIAAKDETPNFTSMSDALDKVLGCNELAAALGGYPTCDVACVKQLCESALASRWEAGLSASSKAHLPGEITISSATGTAQVDEDAAPVAFSAKWIGTFSNGVIAASVAGLVTGVMPAPERAEPKEDSGETP